ncbi:cytochrome P450 [Myriangium duriaei CBS 260.36]|uniref:Cytochrome P450 n=1 Tax=Myriangium duriaei CBS 260.36 TaxID=1168546 RepID=A0A9P4J5K9_9PEZI|nr:cytochrome P450 [Myriangium duriaei CBS 260.36]
MAYGPKWRAHRTIMRRLLSPKATLSFIPSQEFEVKQFLHKLAFDNADEGAFHQHVRRVSFSIVTTSTHGRRIKSWNHSNVHAAGATSALLGRITRPGAFIDDDLPLLSRFPKWLQPSRRAAKGYAKSIGSTGEDCAWIVGDVFEAGAEITSVVLNNLIRYLTATPEAQRCADEGLERVIGYDRCPALTDLGELPYVRACVKEILRLCPVPTWAIKNLTDAEIIYKQYQIPEGTVLLACFTSAMHYDHAHNAQERELGEWKKLLRIADCGLVLKNGVQPYRSVMAVLEIGLEAQADS